MEFPIKEMDRDVLWSLVLVSTTWSYGGVLNAETRQMFDEQFGAFKSKFNITFTVPVRQRFTLFEIYFDCERLIWNMLSNKLELKLK
jgi:hypothetical protein